MERNVDAPASLAKRESVTPDICIGHTKQIHCRLKRPSAKPMSLHLWLRVSKSSNPSGVTRRFGLRKEGLLISQWRFRCIRHNCLAAAVG